MSVVDDKLSKQIKFLIEIDKLKSIYRNTVLIDKSRQETSAEHSWHFAISALILQEYSDKKVDLERVVKMSLIHDLVEIYAGDTFAFDNIDTAELKEKEHEAARVLFNILPDEQKNDFYSLWLEFDENSSDDAQFANSIDRLQPFINEYFSTTTNHPPEAEMLKRMEIIKHSIPKLWEYVYAIINGEYITGGKKYNVKF